MAAALGHLALSGRQKDDHDGVEVKDT